MRHSILLSTAAALALLSSPALAQDAPQGTLPADGSADSGNKLDDIVVTAQKREQNIQTVPLSIVSVSGDTLARAGITDTVALQKLVPSLQINNTFFGAGVVKARRCAAAARSSANPAASVVTVAVSASTFPLNNASPPYRPLAGGVPGTSRFGATPTAAIRRSSVAPCSAVASSASFAFATAHWPVESAVASGGGCDESRVLMVPLSPDRSSSQPAASRSR